jgi:hypothetical protein
MSATLIVVSPTRAAGASASGSADAASATPEVAISRAATAALDHRPSAAVPVPPRRR